MNTKLTLSLNSEIIAKAKKYSKQNKVSLSYLIENYFKKITSEYTIPDNKPGIVEEMSGIISLPPDYDYKESYTDYLDKKYK